MTEKGGYKIKDESYNFALMVIDCCHYLIKETKDFVLINQLFKSGTSVGANIIEAQGGQSRKDFLSKSNIALKEAKETKYRIALLKDCGYLGKYVKEDALISKSNEMVAVLTRIVKTTKESIK